MYLCISDKTGIVLNRARIILYQCFHSNGFKLYLSLAQSQINLILKLCVVRPQNTTIHEFTGTDSTPHSSEIDKNSTNNKTHQFIVFLGQK